MYDDDDDGDDDGDGDADNDDDNDDDDDHIYIIYGINECIQGVRSVRQQSRLLCLVRRSLSPD